MTRTICDQIIVSLLAAIIILLALAPSTGLPSITTAAPTASA